MPPRVRKHHLIAQAPPDVKTGIHTPPFGRRCCLIATLPPCRQLPSRPGAEGASQGE
ncbi:hypothetical protein DDI_0104 [Dickeya dianthicola RNS04.9]|nr:hypothetical protein DDI_0104 [Dickeya dianthicola RNS04.9]